MVEQKYLQISIDNFIVSIIVCELLVLLFQSKNGGFIVCTRNNTNITMMPSITSCLAKTLLQRENVLCKSFNSKKAAESSIGKSKFGIWPILSACKCIHQLVLAKLLSIFQRSIYMYGTCNVGNVL